MSSPTFIQTVPDRTVETLYSSWASTARTSGGTRGRNARIVADYIRHALCRMAAEEDNARAVHIQRLRADVDSQLKWMIEPVDEPPWFFHDDSPDEEPGESSKSGIKGLFALTLERLLLLGDCGGLGGGYYLPVPLRRVVLDSGRSLVIGGLDTKSLALHVGGNVSWAGLARTIKKPAINVPSVRMQDWLGRPDEALPAWTARILGRAATSLRSSPGLDAADFEIYSPVSLFRSGQSNRWASPHHWTPHHHASGAADALHLCRTKLRPRRFWLAPLEQAIAGVRFSKEASVEPTDSRRLMYGIDQMLGVSTKVTIQQSGSDCVEFRLFSWLPNEEYRLLTALCYQTQSTSSSPLPFVFHVNLEYWPDVTAALKGLGILVADSRE